MKVVKKVGSWLNKASYFFPDVFLIFVVTSVINSQWRDAVIFMIAYMATSYGEYMYARVRIAREMMLNDVLPTVRSLEDGINRDYVKMDDFLRVGHAIADEMDEIRDDVLKIKGVAMSEVDKKEQG